MSELFDRLPYYVRDLNEENNLVLAKLLEPAERQFAYWERRKAILDLIDSIDNTPRDWLHYMSQRVGGAGDRDRYLGIGIDPDWPVEYQRKWILQAWQYWGIKGTRKGTRQAIDLWLLWEKAKDRQYYIPEMPFGDRAFETPGRWWGWDDPYHSHLNYRYLESAGKTYGGGDWRDRSVAPKGLEVYADPYRWDWQIPYHLPLASKSPDPVGETRSRLGPRNLWQHFILGNEDWNQISPDIHELDPEILPALVRPSVFLWHEEQSVGTVELAQSEQAPREIVEWSWTLDGLQWGDPWRGPTEQDPIIETETIERPEYIVDFPLAWGDPYGAIGGVPLPSERYLEIVTRRTESTWGTDWQDPYAHLGTRDRIATEIQHHQEVGTDWLEPYGAIWQYDIEETVRAIETEEIAIPGQPWSIPSTIYREVVVREDEEVETPTLPASAMWDGRAEAWIEEIQTEIPQPPSCFPGIDFEVPDGWEWVDVPPTGGEDPNLTLNVDPAIVEEIPHPGEPGWFGFDWLSPWTSFNLESLPPMLSPVEGVDSREIVDSIQSHILQLPPMWGDIYGALGGIPLPRDRYEQEIEVVREAQPGHDWLDPIGEPSPWATLEQSWIETIALEDEPQISPMLPASAGWYYVESFERQPLAIAFDFPVPLSWSDLSDLGVVVTTMGDRWSYEGTPDRIEYDEVKPAEYELAPPWIAWLMHVPYHQGYCWYYPGYEEIPARQERKQKTKLVQLCNVVAAWSTGEMVERDREIIVLPPDSIPLIEAYPEIEDVRTPTNWQLTLLTDESLWRLDFPDRSFTESEDGRRSQMLDLGEFSTLYLEYFFKPGRDTNIYSVSLTFKGNPIYYKSFNPDLNVQYLEAIGFRFNVGVKAEELISS